MITWWVYPSKPPQHPCHSHTNFFPIHFSMNSPPYYIIDLAASHRFLAEHFEDSERGPLHQNPLPLLSQAMKPTWMTPISYPYSLISWLDRRKKEFVEQLWLVDWIKLEWSESESGQMELSEILFTMICVLVDFSGKKINGGDFYS